MTAAKIYSDRPTLHGVAVVKPPFGSGLAMKDWSVTGSLVEASSDVPDGRFLQDKWFDGKSFPAASGDVHVPVAANTAAVVHYAAAGNNRRHRLSGIAWSYDLDPTGGLIKIEDGANVVFSEIVTNKGPGFFPFSNYKDGSPNASMTITVSAGGVGVKCQLSVIGHRVV